MAIEAIVSHTIFYNKGNANAYNPHIEVYWQVNPVKLHYSTTPEKTIVARIRTDIFFSNRDGVFKEDHFILQTVPRTTIADLAKNNIIELRKYNLPSGLIRMKFVLTDLADSLKPQVNVDSFTISPPANSAFFSGLQLLDTTIESAAETEFMKNGHQQIPACTNFLDDTKSTLHYYAELYGTTNISKATYPLIQKVFITKKEHEGFYGNFIKTDTITAKDASPISGSFNIASLPSGNYYLRVTLGNSTRNVLTSESLFFQRLNKHPYEEPDTVTKKAAPVSDTGMESVNLLDLNKTFVAKYKLYEVTAILKMLLPVSDPLGTQNINNFLKNPDDLYMRYYVYNHFLQINKDDPEQAWKDYSAKVITVNKLFGGHGNRGYETDRGFIYLRYGAPTDIITVENEPGAMPYEIWQYNTLTQTNHKEIPDALFLFYKQLMTSDFRLIHSTVDGETQNPSWRDYIFTGGGDHSNSRAEQNIGAR